MLAVSRIQHLTQYLLSLTNPCCPLLSHNHTNQSPSVSNNCTAQAQHYGHAHHVCRFN